MHTMHAFPILFTSGCIQSSSEQFGQHIISVQQCKTVLSGIAVSRNPTWCQYRCLSYIGWRWTRGCSLLLVHSWTARDTLLIVSLMRLVEIPRLPRLPRPRYNSWRPSRASRSIEARRHGTCLVERLHWIATCWSDVTLLSTQQTCQIRWLGRPTTCPLNLPVWAYLARVCLLSCRNRTKWLTRRDRNLSMKQWFIL